MHQNGHFGLSLLLLSPLLPVFIINEMYLLGILITFLTAMMCSIPDIDIKLKSYKFSYTGYPVRYWVWIPILKLSVSIMKFAGRYIERVPSDYKIKKVQHRGITHTIWFGISFGIILLLFFSAIMSMINLASIYYSLDIYSRIVANLKTPLIVITFAIGLSGFLAVLFHCVGDCLTPMGVNFYTPNTNYGYTLDLFYAKNEVANRSALPLGLVFMSYAIFTGFSFGHIRSTYLLGGFIILLIFLIPLWLIFVKTRIGKWTYIVYDFLK